jgi:hypothetical protein
MMNDAIKNLIKNISKIMIVMMNAVIHLHQTNKIIV